MRRILLLANLAALLVLFTVISEHQPRRVSLSCPQEDIEHVRRDPQAIAATFAKCLPKLRNRLPGLSDDELFSIYAMEISNRLAPYGPNDAYSISDLLTAQQLPCQSYARLLAYFHRFHRNAGNTKVFFLAWEGGVYTSHAQVVVCRERCLLLDPTVNVFAMTSIDDVLTRNIPGYRIYDLSTWRGMEDERDVVVNALLFHRLRVEDLRAYVFLPDDTQ
jgi:hypothetical protein